MHFSIPNTEELKDEKGTAYQAFNIHINGVLHCTVRYSQLHDLNEQLKRALGAANLPEFPPKKMWSLKGGNLNERRIKLESYVQRISQESFLNESEEFVSFLHKAQQETRQEETIKVNLTVYILNGKKFSVDINSTDKTDDVLETCASEIGIPEDHVFYFGLYLMHCSGDNKYSVVRKLQGFESPFISLKSLPDRRNHRIVLRKSYWDQSYDDHLLKNNVTFNLLYTQAVHDVNEGWTIASKEMKSRIHSLQKQGSKKECLHVCRTLSHYGYLQFKPCITDFPKPKCRVIVSMGNFEVILRIQVAKNEVKEATFVVTKMKCWKISSDFPEYKQLNSNNPQNPILQLSIEYLVSKGTLQWISMISDQAIMMSMCIKDMVDELLNKRKGGRIRKPSDRPHNRAKPTFKPRDKTTEKLFDTNEIGEHDSLQKAKESVKKFSDKLSSVSIMTTKSINNNLPSDQSEDSEVTTATDDADMYCEGIGDEDL